MCHQLCPQDESYRAGWLKRLYTYDDTVHLGYSNGQWRALLDKLRICDTFYLLLALQFTSYNTNLIMSSQFIAKN